MALLRQVGLGRPMTRAEFDENMNEFPNKFATIAALKAATWLQVGQVVAIEEYHAGVGGGMLFGRIVAGGSGVDDGGSYIDLAASGLQFEQNFPSVISVKMFGAKGDGVTDDTDAIQTALDSTATKIIFPKGRYRIVDNALDGSGTLTSSVSDRIIEGDGVITATSQVLVALEVSGNNTRVGINVDGNSFIGVAIKINGADNCRVSNCNLYNLDGLTNWTGIGVRVNFDDVDASVSVTDNNIWNLQGSGNGIGGDGPGLQRAIIISSNQNLTKASLIANNTINQIEGEEGDAIAVISSNGAGTYYDLPVTIEGNAISLWNRRAIKVQANYVTISNNILNNGSNLDTSSLQSVIDIVQGTNATVVGNTFISCKSSPQITAYRTGSESPATGLIVSNNTIRGVGSETSNSLVSVSINSGSNVMITSNHIIAATYTGTAIFLTNGTDIVVANNVIQTNAGNWCNFSSLTNLKVFGNIHNLDADYQQYFDWDNSNFVFDISAGREILLRNRDAAVSSGELVGSLTIETNDASTPDAKMASIRFVGEGTTGGCGIRIATGNTGSENVEKWQFATGGDLRMLTNGASLDLKDSSGASYALTVDTSGRLLINGTVVGTQT